jgi:hypothetical protein
MRSVLLAILAFLTALPAVAQSETVLVLDPRVLEGELHGMEISRLDASLRYVVGANIGARMLDAKVAFPKTCEAECFVKLAEKHDAAWVLAPSIHAGDKPRLVVRVHDRAGGLVAEGERVYSADIPPKTVESLAVQLLSPPKYAGKMTLTGVPEDAEVNVDAIPVLKRDVSKPVLLRVGEHRVIVERGSARFERVVEVTLADSAAAAPREKIVKNIAKGFPGWPKYAAASVAGAAGLVGLVFAADWAAMPLYRGDSLAGVAVSPDIVGVTRPVLIADQLDRRNFADARTGRAIDGVAAIAFLSAAAVAGGLAGYLFTLPAE